MIVIVFVVLLMVSEGDGADFSLDSSSGVVGKRGTVRTIFPISGKSSTYTRFSCVIRGNHLTKRHFHVKIKRNYLETLL